MNSIQFQYLADQLNADKNFVDCKLLILRGTSWHDPLTDQPFLDPLTQQKLNLSGEKGTKKENVNATFWIKQHRVAVRTKVVKATREITLCKRLVELEKHCKSAEHTYYAKHDPLTGLLNRNGAKSEISSAIIKYSGNSDEPNASQAPSSESMNIALLTFDIDHFKQVNDTYGHGAGDAILSIFAKRLHEITLQVKKDCACEVITSRPGGEEFEMALIGPINSNQLLSITETIINRIRSPSLPTPQEILETSSQEQKYTSDSLPQKINASIGAAFQNGFKPSASIDNDLDKIRGQADQALYRAKSDGRNCVRFFDQIKLRHGRVIQFHKDSELAIIDIGTSVDVHPGDLYKVYFPPFTGESEYIQDDCRSKKKMGEYIAVESAQIQVLHAQENISTCIIINTLTSINIPAGSLLKKVATGSKPRPIPQRHLSVSAGIREKLYDRIETLISKNELCAVINIFPKTDAKGPKEQSEILSNLATLIQLTFPSGSEIFAGNGLNFYLTFSKNCFKSDPASELVSSLKNLAMHMACCAGIYLSDDPTQLLKTNPDTILHLARAALKHAAFADSEGDDWYQFFDAGMTLLSWRNENQFDDFIADYRAFKSYGIRQTNIDNQLGLLILQTNASEKFHIGELAFNAAIDAAADAQSSDFLDYFKGNLAILKIRLEKHQEAFDLFNEISNTSSNTIVSPQKTTNVYGIAFARVAIELFSQNKINQTDLAAILKKTSPEKSSALPSLPYRTWHAEVLEFLGRQPASLLNGSLAS